MNKKRLLGYILIAPVVLFAICCVGFYIYGLFVFYPLAMTIILAIGAFILGSKILSDIDKDVDK